MVAVVALAVMERLLLYAGAAAVPHLLAADSVGQTAVKDVVII